MKKSFTLDRKLFNCNFLFLIILFIVACASLKVNAQGVGINSSGNAADPSAMHDISSTSKGALIPRMTTSQRDAISNPAQALQIFNTTTNCFEAFVFGVWQSVWCACPPVASPTAGIHTSSPTQIVWNWSVVSGATGYKWNTVPCQGS